MTGGDSPDIREVEFVGPGARKAFLQLDEQVRYHANFAVRRIQNSARLPRDMVKELKGSLEGISEIRIDHVGDTYRVYYAARFKEVVFILEAGMKKSVRGGEIPKPTVDLLKDRLATAVRIYQTRRDEFEKRYQEREARRVRRYTPGNDRRPK